MAILAVVALPCALMGVGLMAGISEIESRAKEPVTRPFDQSVWMSADPLTKVRATMAQDVQNKLRVGMKAETSVELLGEPTERPFGESVAWYSLGPSNGEGSPGTLHLVLRFDDEHLLESWWVSND